MNEIDKLLDELRERYGLYIGKKSLDRLTTFISGYIYSVYTRENKVLSFLPGFQELIEDKYGKYSQHHWSQIIEFYTVYEDEAFDKFYDLLDEYREIQGYSYGENSIHIEITAPNISCMTVVKDIVPYEILASCFANKFAINTFNRRLPIECLKKTDDKYYTVIKTEEGWVIVFFSNSKKLMDLHRINISANTSKEKMDTLIEGMSLDDVKKIDSEGDYSFIYRIWLDYPKMSYHYLADGSAYVISYDDNDFINYIYSFIL